MRDDITYEEDGWHSDIATAKPDDLAGLWLKAKEDERMATDRRRMIEERLARFLEVSKALEGTQTHEADGYRIKVTGRMNRKVDAEKLQELATEHGVFDHLSQLFRWKPEINAKAWKATSEAITRPLTEAITTQPGRPSFQIEPIEEK